MPPLTINERTIGRRRQKHQGPSPARKVKANPLPANRTFKVAPKRSARGEAVTGGRLKPENIDAAPGTWLPGAGGSTYTDGNSRTSTKDGFRPVCGGRIAGRLKVGRCGIQLAWIEGKTYLRLCTNKTVPKRPTDDERKAGKRASRSHWGKLIEVYDADDAAKVGREACAEWSADRRYTKTLRKYATRTRHRLGGVKPQRCRYGTYKSGPRKGQCRMSRSSTASNRARKV